MKRHIFTSWAWSWPQVSVLGIIDYCSLPFFVYLWMGNSLSGLKREDCIGNVSSVWQHKVALLDNPSSFVHYFSSFESTNIPSYAIWNLTQPSKLVSHCVFVNFLSNLALNYDFEVLYFGVATFHFFNERSISSLTLSNVNHGKHELKVTFWTSVQNIVRWKFKLKIFSVEGSCSWWPGTGCRIPITIALPVTTAR